ncbi:sugar phosphate isomerase/epimerase [Brachybacterium sp. ACRRE]|uniref:sugar phosphate isomerase/epimerase family protein n=1 Tax=Brachybacterium sp. ACRRE TaxID=2918184 RepID=UPI001EF1F8E4|nr:sugar phosphate isomerase/epimerase family protein [Brachybacterium sp. ACRRE]MCG7309578.1 sugar phosphate isomerase/epimerase [Brachybacterium sp. ACRRE]
MSVPRPAPASRPAPVPRLSLNRWSVRTTPIDEVLAACVDGGVGGIGLWRQDVGTTGLTELRRRVDDAGLQVTSLCRGGFFTAVDPADRRAALEDNRRAIDEAVGLGTDVLVLVVGGLSHEDKDLAAARERVAENIAQLAPHAEQAGVRLAIEPMHPIFAADRGVVSTTAQALDIAEQVGSDAVGAIVDTYHVWWDPDLPASIARAGASGRLLGYQVCDWILPLAAETLNSRGYMGDGFIDFPAITRMIAETGYSGPIEVEIFHEDVWATPVADAVRTIRERFEQLVLPSA